MCLLPIKEKVLNLSQSEESVIKLMGKENIVLNIKISTTIKRLEEHSLLK